MRVICFLFAIAFSLLEAKVTIFAHYHGQPEFIKYQYLFFKRNLLDEYEFVVVEDSNDVHISGQIQNECAKYDIKYIHIPSSAFENPKLPIKDDYISLNAPSFQCSVATQYIYDNFVIPSEDMSLILDNDIFLLSPFSIEKYLGDYSFSYVSQCRGNAGQVVLYMLPNFIIFNPLIMPEKERLDFNMGIIQGSRTDSGGYTHFYLLDYAYLGKGIPRIWLHETPSDIKNRFGYQCPLLFTSKEWGSYYFMEKDTFLHIRMGSNWSKDPRYPQMKQELVFLFENLLNENTGP